MGCGPSSHLSPEERRQQSLRNREIGRQLARDGAAEGRTIKLLLLGAGDSGKSTIVKQVKILHDDGFSAQELASAAPIVYQNVFSSMRALTDAMDQLSIDYENEENRDKAQTLPSDCSPISRDFDPESSARPAELLSALWRDAGVQAAYARRHEFQLQESAAYFLGQLGRVFRRSYAPTQEDMLQLRVRTTGVVEAPFRLRYKGMELNFRLIDVGGQRSERRKWIHCFEGVHAILFVAALSEYNQVLVEDGKTNRLQESLKLFESIVNNAFFVDTSFILFLNKEDLFDQKIGGFPLRDYLPEYDGPAGSQREAKQFIASKFLERVAGPGSRKPGSSGSGARSGSRRERKRIYQHFTCATNTDQIKYIFTDVVKIIIDKSLEEVRLQ